jgi:D-inositol-3-phosphate glycosyltransferase
MNVYVRELSRAMGESGIPVDIFTREHEEANAQIEWIAPNVRVVHLPGGPSGGVVAELFDHLPGFLRDLRSFCQREGLDYDVVHSHYWLSAWLGQRLAKGLGIPHVVTFHTLALIKMQSRAGEVEPEERERVEREAMLEADRIVAFSGHERDAMARLYGADPSKVMLAPCGVDLTKFRPMDQKEARRKLGLNGEKVLLYVGRVEPLKGLDLLVETAAQIESDEKELRMMVVGGGGPGEPETDRVRQLAKERQVDDLIDFVGRVDHDELPIYYNAADVCVVPSYYESFGLVALESMACGTPVVATRAGGLPTLVHHGHTGYLKSWRCPEAFANSVEMIISSERLQQSLGSAARRRAELMGWPNVASMISEEYRALSGASSCDTER